MPERLGPLPNEALTHLLSAQIRQARVDLVGDSQSPGIQVWLGRRRLSQPLVLTPTDLTHILSLTHSLTLTDLHDDQDLGLILVRLRNTLPTNHTHIEPCLSVGMPSAAHCSVCMCVCVCVC